VVSSRTKPDAGQADGWNGGSGYLAVASTVLSSPSTTAGAPSDQEVIVQRS
jgi:hypothetical protein